MRPDAHTRQPICDGDVVLFPNGFPMKICDIVTILDEFYSELGQKIPTSFSVTVVV